MVRCDWSDDDLAQRLMERDPEALETLIARYSRELFYFIRVVLDGIGVAQDAEECVNDLFVAVWQEIDTFYAKRSRIMHMSMSEFDPRLYEPEDSFADRPMLASGLPDDFSEEDLAFAQELGALFSLEKEEMPPLFVTTLLDAENSRFEPVRPGLEQKTYVRVFRRLKLHRSLIRSVRVSLWQGFKDVLPARRSYLVGACVCVCFMLMTMMVTSTAFASGLVYLFAGPHSGVVQYRDTPPVGRALPQQLSSEQQASAAPALSDEKQLDLIQASRLLQFPIYWPSLPDNYTVSKLYLYDV